MFGTWMSDCHGTSCTVGTDGLATQYWFLRTWANLSVIRWLCECWSRQGCQMIGLTSSNCRVAVVLTHLFHRKNTSRRWVTQVSKIKNIFWPCTPTQASYVFRYSVEMVMITVIYAILFAQHFPQNLLLYVFKPVSLTRIFQPAGTGLLVSTLFTNRSTMHLV